MDEPTDRLTFASSDEAEDPSMSGSSPSSQDFIAAEDSSSSGSTPSSQGFIWESSPMATPSSLQSLAAELWNEIVYHFSSCGDPHLGKLRLTCKEIHAKTTFQFGLRHFKTIIVNVDIGGVRRLLEVSRHRLFKSQVKKLYIFADLLTPSPMKFDDNVLDFVRSGSFACELDLAVGRLPSLEQVVLDGGEIHDFLEDRQVEIYRKAWSKTVGTTLATMHKHKVHVKELRVERNIGGTCPPDISILKSVSNELNLFDLITTLHLGLFLGKDDGTAVSALIQFLNSAKTLATLHLSFDRSSKSHKVLSRISQEVEAFPKLQKFELSDTILSSELLIELLQKHKNTLQNLSLQHMFLISGRWSDIFIFFLKKMSLSKLHMMNLYEDEPFEEDLAVCFNEIHSKRPYIDAFWVNEIEPCPDEEEMEFLASFEYVTKEKFPAWITFADSDDDDIRHWLTMLVDNYDLVEDLPDPMY